MLRVIRVSILPLLVIAMASCSDSRDFLSPGTPAQLSGPGAAASVNDKGNDDNDRLPGNLGPVAEFNNNSGSNGAQRATADIGPLGGSLRLGDYEIVVPAGAVTEMTRFTIRTFPENGARKHAVASFSPHRTFNQPITLRMPLSSTESAGTTDAAVGYWNGGDWEVMPSWLTADGRVETRTTHFSCYATMRGFTLAGG